MAGRRRRVAVRRRLRLITVSWLVDEDQVLDLAAVARQAGLTVSVSPVSY